MLANSTSTLTDRGADQADPVQLLTHVLNYDDLRTTRRDEFDFTRFDASLSIGRATGKRAGWSPDKSELRLADEWLSLKHARIVKSAKGYTLRDENSKNGTFVNGVRIQEHVLTDHDLIEVGHTLLCYRVVDRRLADVLASPERRFGPTETRNPEAAMLLHNLRILAASQRPVLLLGETGCGKELAAQLLHTWSSRQGEYVTVDCGAVPDALFESRFFGHLRGAFTGAVAKQEGEIVRASGGTLLLDEVGNLSEAAQTKLLRVIQEGRVIPVGATRSQPVDVRWLAATNAPLYDAGSNFRRDLLRRLGTTQHLPPLRQRREDLGELCAYFLTCDASTAAMPRVSITAEAGRRLFCGRLPGNIRQLREVLLSAALLAGTGPISERELLSADPSLVDAEALSALPAPGTRPSREVLEATLRTAGGNKTAAAQLLGTSVRQLYRWLK